MDLFGCEGKDEDPLFAQNTPLPGRFVQTWKLRMKEAALQEVANSELRRALAYNKSFNSTAVLIGDTALFHKSRNKKSAPRWRGPAKLLKIDEGGGRL